jgi:hypothetical protein
LSPENYHLPRPPFLYTLDQVAQIANVTMSNLTTRLIYYNTLTSGKPKLFLIIANNIAAPGDKPEWRVSDAELERWLKYKGFRPRYSPWR